MQLSTKIINFYSVAMNGVAAGVKQLNIEAALHFNTLND
jgi:hypothetical protein